MPVLGHTHRLWRDPLAFSTRCIQDHGDIVSLQVAGRDAIMLGHPDHIKHVLVDAFDRYEKGEFYRDQFDLFDEGLLISEGEAWRQQRERVSPVFQPDQIKSYSETMVSYAETAANQLKSNERVPIGETMQQLALQIIAKALFSVDIETEVPDLRDAITVVMEETRKRRQRPITMPDWLPTPSHRRYNQAIDTFNEIVEGIIDNHRGQSGPPDNVVSALLSARGGDAQTVTARQIHDEILTLLLAGHDTTALALGYVCHLLSKHSKVQSSVINEIDRVVDDGSPTVADLSELERLERVIKEALRLYPPVYLIAREPLKEDIIGDYRIPAGTIVLFSQWVTHRDSRFFDDPTQFKPNRWTRDNEDDIPQFAYFPFSGGPRRCVGEQFAMMELQLVLAVFLSKYRFEPAPNRSLELNPSFSLRPTAPIEVIPRPR